MPKYQYCLAEPLADNPAILLVTINRPELRNALHPPASHELAEVFREYQTNDAYRVAILTGQGEEAFSSGNDVKFSATATIEDMQLPPEGLGGLTSSYERTKPIISAVNGFAYGGGFEIALASDIIVAVEEAKFALPEPKIGLAALGGGLHRLSRQIPYKKAVEMLITGKSVSASEGEQLGFVNAVVPRAQLITKCVEIAEQIINCSPVSIDITLTGLRQGEEHNSLRDAAKGDYQLAKRIFTSEDFKEGVQAFAEKRKANWLGK